MLRIVSFSYPKAEALGLLFTFYKNCFTFYKTKAKVVPPVNRSESVPVTLTSSGQAYM